MLDLIANLRDIGWTKAFRLPTEWSIEIPLLVEAHQAIEAAKNSDDLC